MQIITIIPARGGSKGIPNKNIAPAFGKPLIAWTIEATRQSAFLDRVIVTTDSVAIAEIASAYGAEVPFLRPPELARDDTPDLPVYQHTLAWLREHQGYQPECVVWLRPTSPMRTTHDIDAAVALLQQNQADCVRSVCLAEHHPYWMKHREDDGRLVPCIEGADEHTYYQRQLLPPVYRLNGAVEVVRCTSVINNGRLYGGVMYGYVMPPERSIDIDTELDLALMELLLQRVGQ